METESTALVSVAPANVEAFSSSPPPEAPTFSLSVIENAPSQLENQMTLFKPEPQADIPEYPDYIDAEIIELAESDPRPPVIEIHLPGEEGEIHQEEETHSEVAENREEKEEVQVHDSREQEEESREDTHAAKREDEREMHKQETTQREIDERLKQARKLAHAELERRTNEIDAILLMRYGYENPIILSDITSLTEEVVIEESNTDVIPFIEVYTLFEANITLLTRDGAIQLDGHLKGAGTSIRAVSYTEVIKTGEVIAEIGSKKELEENEQMYAWAMAKNMFKRAMDEYRKNKTSPSKNTDLLARAEAASRLVDGIEEKRIAEEIKQTPWKGIVDFLAMTMSHSSAGSDAGNAGDAGSAGEGMQMAA